MRRLRPWHWNLALAQASTSRRHFVGTWAKRPANIENGSATHAPKSAAASTQVHDRRNNCDGNGVRTITQDVARCSLRAGGRGERKRESFAAQSREHPMELRTGEVGVGGERTAIPREQWKYPSVRGLDARFDRTGCRFRGGIMQPPQLRIEDLAFHPFELADARAREQRPARVGHGGEGWFRSRGPGNEARVCGGGPRFVETPAERHAGGRLLAARFFVESLVALRLQELPALDQLGEILRGAKVVFKHVKVKMAALHPDAEGVMSLPCSVCAGREQLVFRNDLTQHVH